MDIELNRSDNNMLTSYSLLVNEWPESVEFLLPVHLYTGGTLPYSCPMGLPSEHPITGNDRPVTETPPAFRWRADSGPILRAYWVTCLLGNGFSDLKADVSGERGAAPYRYLS